MRRSPNFQNFPFQRNNYTWHKSNGPGNNMHDMRHNRPNYGNYNNFNQTMPPTHQSQPPPPPNEQAGAHNAPKKSKNKSVATRTCKNWVREEAVRALELENEYLKNPKKAPTLLLRFPDPELNRSIVTAYSPEIVSVHFQLNAAPRYCFVQLKEGADADKVMENISKIPFGTGTIHAELKRTQAPTSCNVDEVDPCTLYVGNLSNTISRRRLEEHFPNVSRTDIGFAQRIKGTRYAILRYDSAEKAIEDFKNTVNSMIDNRSLVVRFLRKKGLNTEQNKKASEEGSATDNSGVKAQDKKESNDDTTASGSSAKKVRLSPNATLSTGSSSAANANIDSKDNVLAQASRLQGSTPYKMESPMGSLFNQNGSSNNTSADISYNIGANTSNASATDNPLANITIKQEITEDDLSEEEVMSNYLGARYGMSTEHIKREIDDNQNDDRLNQEMGQNYFDDDEFAESEAEDEHWPNPQKLPTTKQPDIDSAGDVKPSVEELQDHLKSNRSARENTMEHSTFMKKLYEQNKRMKDPENKKRPRNDMDDVFSKMNSDSEDEEFF